MDKNKCISCGEPKCSCKNKDFTKAVIEIDNPEQITLMRRVVIPASMGDDTTVPPVVGKYHNVLLFYEANSKSYLYSSDGIPTLLANGLTDYEQAVNLPQINGYTLLGDQNGEDLGLQNRLTASDGIRIDENNNISVEGIDDYAHSFDVVSDMKTSTNLRNGDRTKTLGYYAVGDKGGAVYKIRTKTGADTADEMTLIDLYDNTLIAELVKTNIMNVRQFGAKGDGSTDDTVAIQTALDFNSNIQIPDGVYMVDAVTELKPNTGNKIEISEEAKLKAITNDSTHYRIFHILDVNDVEISGGTLEGDRLTHTGSTGEWGNCIRVFGDCTNIHLHDMNLINAWGDGLGVAITGSIHTERLHIKNARRNGMSLGGATEFVSTDDFVEDTNGTNPQCGVDIEPDHDYNLLRNVVFNNLNCKNNAANGLEFGLSKDNTGYPSNIQINNFKSEGDNRGIWIEPGEKNIGVIEINNPYINNSKSSALFIRLHSILHKISIKAEIADCMACTIPTHTALDFCGKCCTICVCKQLHKDVLL